MARLKVEDRAEWERRGGRVRVDSKGRPVYVIRKQVAGQRFEVSTRKHTLAAALSEWEKFERNPEGYHPGGDPSTAAVYLDNDISTEFLKWSKDEGNTLPWVGKQKSCLAWWMEKLQGVNLRRASLRDHILPPLEGAPGRAHKIRVLKTFFGWLRKVKHIIAAHEDCTFGALPAPQSTPAQWKRSKVVPRDHVLLAIEQLTEPWRDALAVQAGSGLHTSEIVRFAAGGTIEPLPRGAEQEGVAGVLCVTQHKSGEPLRVRVSAEVVAAAKRLLKHGPISREWYDRAVRAACVAVKRPDGGVGIPVFTPGRLRHSVASWAINAGADPAVVSAYLGHKSPRTTRKFYAVFASPTKVPTLV